MQNAILNINCIFRYKTREFQQKKKTGGKNNMRGYKKYAGTISSVTVCVSANICVRLNTQMNMYECFMFVLALNWPDFFLGFVLFVNKHLSDVCINV